MGIIQARGKISQQEKTHDTMHKMKAANVRLESFATIPGAAPF